MAGEKVAVYPGVFDPVTLGHLDIIRRGTALFDRLIVAVDSYEGLTVEFVRRHGASVILRGLRQHSDFEYEYQLALTNRTIAGVETVFVMADEKVAYISSRLVREVASLGGDVSKLVPPNVAKALGAKLKKT